MNKELLAKANKYMQYLDYEEFEERVSEALSDPENEDFTKEEIREAVLEAMVEEIEESYDLSDLEEDDAEYTFDDEGDIEEEIEDEPSEEIGDRGIKKKILYFLPYVLMVVSVAFFVNYTLMFGSGTTTSMVSSICPNDLCVYSKIFSTSLERGDIVTFYSDEVGGYVTKRVVGLPGETISFKDGCVYIDGKKLDESSYLADGVETHCSDTFLVPENGYFLLGDNRMVSDDSRFWDNPFISINDIEGKLITVVPLHKVIGGSDTQSTESGDY